MTREEWTPEHREALARMLADLWPNGREGETEHLTDGIVLIVERGRHRPSDVFTAVVDVAEEGREYVPSVGHVANAMARRRASREGIEPPGDPGEHRQIEARSKAQPWAASLWTAAFVEAGGRERRARLTGRVLEHLRPWLTLVREVGLRPAHGVDTHPEHDAQLVALANTRARDVWDAHGGIDSKAALRVMGGRS